MMFLLIIKRIQFVLFDKNIEVFLTIIMN